MKHIYIAALLFLAASTHAALRTSASYSIATDTVNSAGGRSASASYVNEGSLGGFGGISTAPAPVEIAKHGYIGQLYDASLQLSASPTNVNEGATRQLAANQLFDDSTLAPIPANQIAWSVLSGPLAGINSSGLATAAIVYQNSNAIARGTYLGNIASLTLNVVNINIDDFGTYAGDGIDDAWQVQYFGLNNTNAAPTQDPDGDEQNNAFEYTAGLVPTNASSKFLLNIFPGLAAGQKRIVFSPRFVSRTYTVMYHTNVDDPAPLVTLGSISTADIGAERTVTDLSATATNRFYKVRITFP